MRNGIYFYKADFYEYSKNCTGVMPNYPEGCNDTHICATFVFNGKEGFSQSKEGREITSKILINCISIGRIIICPKNDKIKSAIDDHGKYILNKKKYDIISRHKKIEAPNPHFLAGFIEREILDDVSYEFFIENAYFVARESYSEKHGSSAGVYNLSLRKTDICNLKLIRRAIVGYDCFHVPYCDLPVH